MNQVGLHRKVVFKEGFQIHHQIFDDPEKGQGFDHKIVGGFKIPDQFLTGQPNPSIDHQGI
jgi:hypothetical protein